MRAIAAVIACALALPAPPAWASDATVVRGLVRSAWYWQSRARDDKAEDAWKAVLAADPDQPDAIAALGGVDARAGREKQARDALARLQKLAPHHPDVPVLKREIELGPRLGAMLASARKLVHGGRVDEGVAQYREIFGAAGPPGDLALEYYETVGGTPGGWEEARDGLQRLVRRVPREARFRLALARLLTYRPEARRQGISMLAGLARDPTVSREATASWKEVLSWLGDSPDDAPLLREYLAAHPGDRAIRAKLERARRAGLVAEGYAALDRGDTEEAARRFAGAGDLPDARRGLAIVHDRETAARLKAGYAALDRGELDAAERVFQQVAREQPDARLGLALVAQRRAAAAQRAGDLGRAKALLERARTLAPRRPDVWEAQLQSVEFWRLLEDARASRRRGRDDAAEIELREALARAPEQDRWSAELELADLRQAHGGGEEAERLYRDVLSRVPGQPDALRGLTSLLVQARRFAEAIPTNEALLRASPRSAYRQGWLRAETRRSAAAGSRAAGDLGAARASLEAARRDDPADVWVLHDLANVLLEAGDTAAAGPVVSALLAAAPRLREARIVEARLLAARGESARALDVLSTVPGAERDPGLVALRHRLDVDVRVPVIVDRASGGARAAAVRELTALEREVAAEPELTGAVALAWARIGERKRAVALMQAVIARAPGGAQATRLELASTLLQAGDDAGANAVIEGLQLDPKLTPDQRRWLADLRISRAVRVADGQRTAGRRRAASAALDPVVRDYPDDPRVLDALGRLLEASDPGRAHATYLRVLARNPGDADARRGAVDTALRAGDLGEARSLAGQGVRRAPDDARMQLLAARVAESERDDSAAMRALRRAQEISDAAARGDPPLAAGSAGSSAAEPRADVAAAMRAAADPGTRTEIAREMERVRDRHQPGLEAGGEIRVRRGEPGLSALAEYRQTLASEVPIGYAGRAWFRPTGVELDAGGPASSALNRFGTGSAGASPGAMTANGVAIAVGYEGRDLEAELGTSPLGFPIYWMLGRLRLQHDFGGLRLAVEGARRSVTESMLSYAGVRDPATGSYWGGVVSQGGRAELALDLPRTRVYAYGAYDGLQGYHVADNRRTTGGAGADVTLLRGEWGAVTIGAAALGMAYDRNLSFFTFGHGGYFSPQRFVRGGVPVGWRREGTVHWELVAEPALERFETAGAPAFPDVPGVSTAGRPSLDPYPGRTVNGFALDAHAMLGVSIGGFELRATGAVHRAPEYDEVVAGVVLRYGGGG